MVSQVDRFYPRTRRAVGPVSQTDRFYDDTRDGVRCPYVEGLEEHAKRKDNPHEVTAEQVAFAGGGEQAQVLNEAADNWGTCWGFAFDLRTLAPEVWPVPGESAARLFNIQLRASDNEKYFTEPKTVRLRLVDEATGLDACSDNAITVAEPLQWLNFIFSGADPEGLRLPSAKADLFPHLNTLNFALEGPTFAAAIVALRGAVDAKQDPLVAGENIAIEGNVISATGVDPTTSARIAALEQGRGIYKDPKTGKVSVYTPLPECPDGTLKVIMDLGFGTKVLPVEEADSVTDIGCFDDGEHLFLFNGTGDLSTAWGYKPPIYVYDKDLNRICRKSSARLWFGGGEVLRFAKDWSAFIHISGDRFFFQGNDGRIFRMDLQDDTMPERNIPNPGDSPIALWHNSITGHPSSVARPGISPARSASSTSTAAPTSSPPPASAAPSSRRRQTTPSPSSARPPCRRTPITPARSSARNRRTAPPFATTPPSTSSSAPSPHPAPKSVSTPPSPQSASTPPTPGAPCRASTARTLTGTGTRPR